LNVIGVVLDVVIVKVPAWKSRSVTVPVIVPVPPLKLVELTVIVGVIVSTVKLPVEPAAPVLPLFSDQLPAVTLPEALLMSVLALPVNVAE
jgi:hypothetical protein